MKRLFWSAKAKIIVDILLVIGLILSGMFSHMESTYDSYWLSPHCISGVLWFLMVVFHVWQHWPFIKALIRKKVIVKNKITTLTTIVFIGMLMSILSFITEVGIFVLQTHHILGRLFILMVIIHTINKYKRFVSLFRR